MSPRDTARPVAPTDGTCCAHWPLCGAEVTGHCCNARPTLAYPRCSCGGALDGTHRCADPVADAVEAYLAAEAKAAALPPTQRAEVSVRLRAAMRARTAERLARGPG